MAQYEGSYPQRDSTRSHTEISGWAVGFTFFASMMLMIIGSFHFISGMAAVINDDFYIIRSGYDISLDVQTWGWIHMIGGIVVMVAGFGLLAGAMWARIVAIFLAIGSAIWSFYSIPYYPVWSILIIALNVGVIWALTAHGSDFSSDDSRL